MKEGILDSDDAAIYDIRTRAPGPPGRLPLTEEILARSPSGDLFGWTENAGMGWEPSELGRKEFLILGVMGGLRGADGEPIALGLHSGHWEVGLLVEEAARELKSLGTIPFAAYLTDPCDGRTQGTPGMFDSLAFRNDACTLLRRLIRSLPTRRGVMGIATCDKALPAMMMALSGMRERPCILVPGGSTLPPEHGEDAATIQSIGARFAHGLLSLDEAAVLGCRACASPGGGCQFLGTAGTSQVVAEGLGLALPHSALAPSGQPVWRDLAKRSARALVAMEENGLTVKDVVTAESLRNAMVVHAAFGGSTNLLLHLPAIAHAAGLERPTVEDWIAVNRQTPRLVSVLPNGPVDHPTVRVFLAGGAPEVMLHLRDRGLLHGDCRTVSGERLDRVLDWWASSERRARFRQLLQDLDGVDPEEVILSPEQARARGVTSTVTFPIGNLAPEGSVIKSTAIDPRVVDDDNVFRKTGPARVFTTEPDAIAAIKSTGPDAIKPGDVLVLICRGPLGSGMEETYQLTAALKHLPWGKDVAVVTDARFSGLTTGGCIGHVGPEALAGGPIGKLQDRDLIRIIIDRNRLEGSVDLVGHGDELFGAERGAAELARREPRADLRPDKGLPPETRLWAALQQVGGGTWGGCVFDVDAILAALKGRAPNGP